MVICLLGCFRREDSALEEWFRPNGKIKVLCTTEMVADLVSKVGSSDIDCLTLISGEHDPHSYQLVKGDNEKFIRADVIFFNGLGLEHGPTLSHFLHNNPKAIALGESILQQSPDQILLVDGVYDPHIWMDMSLFSKALPAIAEKLSEVVPEKKAVFVQRALDEEKELLALHASMRALMQKVPAKARYLVTAHDAFNYFTRAYLATEQEIADNSWQERCRAPEGLAPDSQLSTHDITQLVEYIRMHNVRCLFMESNVNHDSIFKLLDASKKLGLDVHIVSTPLYADAMGAKGSAGDGYKKMISYDVIQVATELGKYDSSN